MPKTATMAPKVLVVDNYDSFTYNLVQFLGYLGADLAVYRNDRLSLELIEDMKPDRIVISPGPKGPQDAGLSGKIIRRFSPSIKTLGVCLGHQCIGDVFGGCVVRAEKIIHGKTSLVYHDGDGVFRDMPQPFKAARYHSLVVDESSLPPEFTVSAHTQDGVVMGLRHREYAIEGIQFHPESFMTEEGLRLLKNFLEQS